jgi:hypothetical protein
MPVETGTFGYGGAWTWSDVIGYEVQMLTALLQIPSTHPARSEQTLNNCISEGIVLHTRNLCDFCIPNPRFPDVIKPADLFANFDTDQKYQKLRELMNSLQDKYDTDSDPSNYPGSVRDMFNKRLAHPTKDRTQGFDYAPYLNRVLPVLEQIIGEMVALGGLRSIGPTGGPSP